MAWLVWLSAARRRAVGTAVRADGAACGIAVCGARLVAAAVRPALKVAIAAGQCPDR